MATNERRLRTFFEGSRDMLYIAAAQALGYLNRGNKIFDPFFTTKEPGKGSTFYLLLPIAGPRDTPAPAPAR